MARRDNKTEHVMKLITKDGVVSNDSAGNGVGGLESVEAGLLRPEGDSLNYKTKLKIEIEPELAVKEPVRVRQPRSRSVSIAHGDGGEDHREPHMSASSDAPFANATDAQLSEADAVASIPDGMPYERPNESFAAASHERPTEGFAPPLHEIPAERPAAAPPNARATVYDEVRALREADVELLKQAEQRREKKIQIENSLLTKSRSLINLSEVLTKELLPSVMERMDVCTCPVCTGNVLALALNTLPTKYVTTDEGKQYTQLEVYKRQNELDVIAALTRACVRVKSSPRHEIIDDLD